MSGRSPLRQLHDAGISVWLDDLHRPLIEDGTLARYVELHAVSGVTCNPTIFARAVQASDRYDAQLAGLVRHGPFDPREAYFALALADVRQAARVLAGTHARSGGRDGYVSFECTPDVAWDADATVRQALEVRRRVPAANLMVKVPATPPGIEAIERLTAAGVNVNVTLLFTAAQYDAAARAYQRGLARRVRAGEDAGAVRSVASVFVSRLDAIADGLLPAGSPLRGRAGIAVCQRVAAREHALARTRTWAKLRRAGGHPQRLLWASTAPKDAGYPDVMYVEALALPDTIVTLPEPTLLAFADHGSPRPRRRTPVGAARTLENLRAAGVDVDDVGDRLRDDGLRRFSADYERALAAIQRTAARIAARVAA